MKIERNQPRRRYSIQIMNGYECNDTDVFMRRKIECSVQRGEAKLNRTLI